MIVRAFAAGDRAAVVGLWRRADLIRPWNDPDRDIDRKLGRDAEMLLVADDGGVVVGTIMVGYEGHRGWLNYLAVDPERRGDGVGGRLVAEGESRLAALGCPKVNLQVRGDNAEAIEFYERLGYVIDDVVGMGKRLVDDEAPDRED